MMSSSDIVVPTSSMESSPNIISRGVPSHIVKKLPLSQQIEPGISDLEFNSDQGCEHEPSCYYVSPSKPDKRCHVSVQSPRIERLSILGLGAKHRFKPSIPRYG